MTVTANTTRNDYTAGSAQSVYNYTFQLNEAADVDVYLDGVKQTLNTHYIVQNVGNASGGTIVFTLEDENGDPIHPTEGAVINIVMAMDLDRDTNYQPSGAFLAADVNNDFDRLWLATNQQQTAVNRALRLKDTDVTTSSMELPLKDDRKGKLLGFNATTGDPEATTNNQSNWDTAYNNMITSASFTGGNYTLTQQDGGTISTSLDGRYLQLTGGTLTGTLTTSNIAVASGSALTFATSALVISSNGTESIIRETGVGDLSIEGENLYLRSTPTANYLSGTAGAEVKLYHNNSEKLSTTSTGISVTGNLDFGDDEAIRFGDSNDLLIYHNGTSSIIQDSGTGDLALLGTNLAFANSVGSSYYAAGTDGGAFTLYYNGQPKLATTSGGISVTGTITATGYNDSNWNAAYNDKINSASFDTSNGVLTLTQQDGGTVTVDLDGRYSTDTGIALGDNQKATFGDSNDLQIYHDGSNSYIQDNGTGSLILEGTTSTQIKGSTFVILRSTAGENMAIGNANGSFDLYYDNAKKLATTATGIDVTGTVTADGLTVSNVTNSVLKLESTGTGLGSGAVIGDIQFYGNDASVPGVGIKAGIKVETVAALGDDAQMKFTTSDGATNNIDRMLIANNGDISFYEDTGTTAKFFWDASAERLGIGTTSPARELSIGDGTGSPNIQLLAASAGNSRIEFGDAEDSDAGEIQYVHSSNYMQFTTNGSERLRIDSSGRVGIGTSSPSTPLHVKSATDAIFRLESSDSNSWNYMEFQGNTARQGWIGSDNNDAIQINADNASKILLNGGNVGIGTNSPSDKFHVANGSTGAGYLRIANNEGYARLGTDGGNLLLDVGGSEKARIDSSGNVGIGTTSPSHKFHVSGSNSAARFSDDGTGFSLDIEHDTANGITTLQQTNSGGDLRLQGGSASGLLLFETSGSERMRIDASGNVGIGTTSPSSALDVNGTVTATAFAGDGSNLTGVLSDLVDDTTPQLGGALDANDKEIQNVNQIGIGFSGNVNYNIQVEDTKPLTNVEMVRIKNTSNTFGRVMTFYKSSNHHGSIGLSSVNMGQGVFVSSQQGGLKFQNQFSTVVVEPCGGDGSDRDNSVDLGRSSNRFDDIYATNSTIQTSDRNLKQDVESLTDAEQRVAVAAKGLLRKFRWIDAVEEKGDDARIHFGIMAQDLRDAFTAEGLDAGRYAMFTSTTWWEHEGENYYEADHAPEGATEVTRLGVRYSELLAFIISAI
jgi:hypothetical protein